MKNFEEFINEAVNYKDRSGKSFKVKGINFIYTEYFFIIDSYKTLIFAT